jgi:hypothetical protein
MEWTPIGQAGRYFTILSFYSLPECLYIWLQALKLFMLSCTNLAVLGGSMFRQVNELHVEI